MSDKTAMLRAVQTKAVRDRVSNDEWEMRRELAAAYHLADRLRWMDLIFMHFTARVPGTHHMLIKPYGLMFDEMTASSLVKIDEAGNVIDDTTGLGINHAGFVIHGCVHAAS